MDAVTIGQYLRPTMKHLPVSEYIHPDAFKEYEAIGDELGVSVETVRTHVRNVIRKLQARNRVHAIAIALERGEIALSDPTRSQR